MQFSLGEQLAELVVSQLAMESDISQNFCGSSHFAHVSGSRDFQSCHLNLVLVNSRVLELWIDT